MNRPGAGPQTLRNIPGNVFQNQPASGPRANPIGGSRLQNGKLGSGSGWAFGGGIASPVAPQNSQVRPTASNVTSFAQTIGGAQNQASLDPSGRKNRNRTQYETLDYLAQGASPGQPRDDLAQNAQSEDTLRDSGAPDGEEDPEDHHVQDAPSAVLDSGHDQTGASLEGTLMAHLDTTGLPAHGHEQNIKVASSKKRARRRCPRSTNPVSTAAAHVSPSRYLRDRNEIPTLEASHSRSHSTRPQYVPAKAPRRLSRSWADVAKARGSQTHSRNTSTSMPTSEPDQTSLQEASNDGTQSAPQSRPRSPPSELVRTAQSSPKPISSSSAHTRPPLCVPSTKPMQRLSAESACASPLSFHTARSPPSGHSETLPSIYSRSELSYASALSRPHSQPLAAERPRLSEDSPSTGTLKEPASPSRTERVSSDEFEVASGESIQEPPHDKDPLFPRLYPTLPAGHGERHTDSEREIAEEAELTRNASEFPSLSGAPQAQQQNPSAIWSNPNLRANANQRPQTQTPSHAQQASQTSHSQPSQRSEHQDGQAGTFPPLSNGDEMRFDERAVGNRSSRTSGQQGSGDDFPPLGGLGDSDLRQTSSSQVRFNGIGSGLYGQQQSMRGFGQESHLDGLVAPNASGAMISPSNITSGTAPASRSLADHSLDDPGSFLRSSQAFGSRVPQAAGPDTFSLPHRGHPPNQTPQGQPLASDSVPSAPADPQNTEYQQMSELDRFGLNGFMAQLRSGNQDHVGLMLGMDLNSLGLDLHRQEPLWQEWAGPFASLRSHPIVPDFKLPAAYSVHNVPPLHSKISSFSDETLFAIFYGNPRDISQELAAHELYARDWRWHKKMQQWMMKAKEFGEPVQLPSNKEERGWYYFFDVHNWRRERKEFILNYEHLYHGHNQTPINMP